MSWRHPRALRASVGSALRLVVLEDVAASAITDPALFDGERIGLCARGDELATSTLPDRLLLAVGSEAHGLSEPVRSICDRLVAVPMAGAVESLNVAVAAGIVLYEWRRRTLGHGL